MPSARPAYCHSPIKERNKTLNFRLPGKERRKLSVGNWENMNIDSCGFIEFCSMPSVRLAYCLSRSKRREDRLRISSVRENKNEELKFGNTCYLIFM
jgi:hypothetical protein